MVDPNRALFEAVLDLLRPLLEELVFVGGCATGLLVSDPAAGGIRPTKDVDAIVDVTSYTKYEALSERLRALGLTEDSTEGAPLCRWRYQDLIVDVMPIDDEILGFSNRWYPRAIASAERRSIGGTDFRIVTPVYFVATKLEAFHGRGTVDLAMSHDLEDVITLVDGRPELIAEIAAAARWDEIDRDAKMWTIPGTRIKAGREHRVPLSPRCLVLLEKAETLADGGPFVFPGRRPEQPLSNMAFLMVLRRLKRDDIVVHGFRSSFRDWAAERTNFPRTVCEAALAHVVKDKTEAAYFRSDLLDQRRDLMNTWSAYATSKPAAVVPIRA